MVTLKYKHETCNESFPMTTSIKFRKTSKVTFTVPPEEIRFTIRGKEDDGR